MAATGPLGQGGRPLSLHPPKGPGCLRGGTPFPRHLSESGNQEASLSQPRFLLSDSQRGWVWVLRSLVSGLLSMEASLSHGDGDPAGTEPFSERS